MAPLLYFRPIMTDFLLNIDTQLLLLINQGLSNPIFDFFMPFLDNVKNWIPLILLLWIYMVYSDRENRYKLLILIPLVIIIGDQFGRYIKHMELRDRPWFALGDIVNHLGGSGGKHYSFPSNHALNTAAIMTVFSSIYKRYSNYFLLYLFIIMFSRVYLGVHYPLDTIVGAAIGFFIGFGCFRLVDRML